MGARTRWGRGLRRGGLDRCCQAGASEEGHEDRFDDGTDLKVWLANY